MCSNSIKVELVAAISAGAPLNSGNNAGERQPRLQDSARARGRSS
jgi:hypothetical protein